MPTGRFVASVQYNDWRGTSAADSADAKSPGTWLEENGYKKAGEFLIGIQMWAGEYHGTYHDPVSVEFLLITADGYDNAEAKINAATGPVEVRVVSVDMNSADFLALFKRFAVAFSPGALFDKLEYSYLDEGH